MTATTLSAQSERDSAMSIYKPPFKFRCGYIFDADGHMVADDVIDGVKAARVRGWGRISYLPEPEKLQGTIGEIIADALTQYWTSRAAASAQATTHPTPIAISTEKICEVAKKYNLGNPRLDALRGFVNEIIIVNGAEYAKSE